MKKKTKAKKATKDKTKAQPTKPGFSVHVTDFEGRNKAGPLRRDEIERAQREGAEKGLYTFAPPDPIGTLNPRPPPGPAMPESMDARMSRESQAFDRAKFIEGPKARKQMLAYAKKHRYEWPRDTIEAPAPFVPKGCDVLEPSDTIPVGAVWWQGRNKRWVNAAAGKMSDDVPLYRSRMRADSPLTVLPKTESAKAYFAKQDLSGRDLHMAARLKKPPYTTIALQALVAGREIDTTMCEAPTVRGLVRYNDPMSTNIVPEKAEASRENRESNAKFLDDAAAHNAAKTEAGGSFTPASFGFQPTPTAAQTELLNEALTSAEGQTAAAAEMIDNVRKAFVDAAAPEAEFTPTAFGFQPVPEPEVPQDAPTGAPAPDPRPRTIAETLQAIAEAVDEMHGRIVNIEVEVASIRNGLGNA